MRFSMFDKKQFAYIVNLPKVAHKAVKERWYELQRTTF
jgi:hypothetical protein